MISTKMAADKVVVRKSQPAPSSDGPQPVKSADRVVEILELLARGAQPLSLSEIAQELGLARSSTHGLLHTLVRRGYLSVDDSQNPRRAYRLGPRLLYLGAVAANRTDFREVVREPLQRASARSGGAAFLAIPRDGSMAYIDIIESRPISATDPRLGSRLPYHCTSLGKALLATLDEKGVSLVVERFGLEPATPNSCRSIEQLRSELEATRERGYAVDREEAVLGVACVAAPISDYTGIHPAAVSISMRMDEMNFDEVGMVIAEAALEISHSLGWEGTLKSLYRGVPGNFGLLL